MDIGVEQEDTTLGKYQLDRKADGPQSRPGRAGEKAVMFLACRFRQRDRVIDRSMVGT
jgi:hypothetical protein